MLATPGPVDVSEQTHRITHGNVQIGSGAGLPFRRVGEVATRNRPARMRAGTRYVVIVLGIGVRRPGHKRDVGVDHEGRLYLNALRLHVTGVANDETRTGERVQLEILNVHQEQRCIDGQALVQELSLVTQLVSIYRLVFKGHAVSNGAANDHGRGIKCLLVMIEPTGFESARVARVDRLGVGQRERGCKRTGNGIVLALTLPARVIAGKREYNP